MIFTANQSVFGWGLVAFLFVFDIIFLVLTEFSLAPMSLARATMFGALLAAILFVLNLPVKNQSLANVADKFQPIFSAIGYIFVLGVLFAPFSYISVSLNLPLIDGWLARLDNVIGFNWLGWLVFVDSVPFLSAVLTLSYHSVGPLAVVLILTLGLTGRKKALGEFALLFAVTMVVVLVLSALFPALGAFLYYRPRLDLLPTISDAAAVYHAPAYEGLRDGSLRIVDLSDIKGFVTFPSFHTAAALIVAHGFRAIRPMYIFSSLLAVAVLISTLSVGGHHLVDVFGGIGVTMFAVWFIKRLERWPLGAVRGKFVPIGAWVKALPVNQRKKSAYDPAGANASGR